jgi:hypothetical protein
MKTDRILAIANEILAHDGSEAARRGRFERSYPEFVEAYPKLFDMCCGAHGDQAQGVVKAVLPFMLERLTSIGADAVTAESASKDVYEDLNTRYVNHLVPPVPTAESASDRDT